MNTSQLLGHRWLFLASLGIAVGAAAAGACAAPPSAVTSESNNTEADDLEVLFSPAYSAHDGEHEFKIPLSVAGVNNIDWSASDPDMVDLDPQSKGLVLVTTRKPGTVTITAKKGSLRGTTKLTITDATAEEWEAGNARYNNGIVLKRGERRDGGGGGWEGGTPSPERQQAACTNCHARGKDDVEHTPMQTGGYSDQELIDIFTKGQKPEGAEMRLWTAERWSRIHKWTMDEHAVKGLVVYLRSLEPKSQGPIDWGGRGGGGKRDGGSRNEGSSQ